MIWGVKLRTRRSGVLVSMPEIARLTEPTEWIDLMFVERDPIPREIIKKVFATISRCY
jgi:hypothetical protein